MFCIFIPVFTPIGWIAAQDSISTGAVTYSEEEATGYHRAVFAQYLAVIPNAIEGMSVNCAISISNVCAIPDPSLDIYIGDPGIPTSGGFAIFLYDRDGTVYSFFSRDHSLVGYYGPNPNGNGTLSPGQTYTVNLQEVLSAVKGGEAGEFAGYGWILSEFDGLAGTYNNTIYGLGFTQAFELKPAMGRAAFSAGFRSRMLTESRSRFRYFEPACRILSAGRLFLYLSEIFRALNSGQQRFVFEGFMESVIEEFGNRIHQS